jgi:N-acetyl-alpha-D-muramate 1-phosphate uridylyltransferase
MKIDKAMILAAGLGTRLRPITNTIPKPLVKICNKALIDWGLDALKKVQVGQAIVNVHYLADQLEQHLQSRTTPAILFSNERDELLDSGGGIKKALPLLGNDPFYVINSDTFWLDENEPNLLRVANFFNDSQMDILLMLASHDQATGHDGLSDFILGDDGRLTRANGINTGYIYAGVAILHPRIFAQSPNGAHSLNVEFNLALKNNRLFGLPMQGQWITVGTPDAIKLAETIVTAHEIL